MKNTAKYNAPHGEHKNEHKKMSYTPHAEHKKHEHEKYSNHQSSQHEKGGCGCGSKKDWD